MIKTITLHSDSEHRSSNAVSFGLSFVLCLVLAATLQLATLEAEQPKIKKLLVAPKAIKLSSHRSTEQVIVFGIDELGRQFDVTTQCKFDERNGTIRVNSAGKVLPVRDGQSTLEINYAGIVAKPVPIVVSQFTADDPVCFETETVAILTKHGCNAGSCHGSPKGKGGFSLSLFGYDVGMDRRALLFDGFNRRINVLAPENSLLLKKPMLRVSHVGGKRLQKNDPGFGVLRRWIEEGARIETEDPLRCVSIAITPGEDRELHFLSPVDQTDRYQPLQQLRVYATYSDGSQRNVTQLATFDTTDKKVVTVSDMGQVRALARGQAAITVRYLEHLTSIHFAVLEPVPGYTWQVVPEFNFIDKYVNQQLKRFRFAAAKTCNDATFLRRLSLDLTGMLPDEETTTTFLKSADKDKRKKLIDNLLQSDAYARFWSLKLADLMRVSASRLKDGKAEIFARWIQDEIRTGTPYNELAKNILLAKGPVRETPPALFFEAFPTTEERTETTAQVFMGTRIQCAKCHNHPFENWTQTDYYRIGAAFHHIEFANEAVRIANKGPLVHPTNKLPLRPWGQQLGSEQGPEKQQDRNAESTDQRTHFTRWLTASDNKYFSRVAVNRIWAHVFGVGIVDPVDDFRSSNPPSNVALLDALAQEFREHHFDQRHMLRVICNSQTYQRATVASSKQSSEALKYGTAYPIRLMSAEQIQDAIGIVAGRLTPLKQIRTKINRLKKSETDHINVLEGKVAALTKKIDESLKSPDVWFGGWWLSPAFNHGGFNATRDKEFISPSTSAYGADGEFNALPDWQLQKHWSVGNAHLIHKKNNTANYLMSHIFVPKGRGKNGQGGKMSFRADGDDDLQMWLNGVKVAQNKSRIIEATLTLKEGRNTLLLKVTNQGGDCTWQIRNLVVDGKPIKTEFPGYLRESFLSAPNNKMSRARDYLRNTDAELTRIRRELAQAAAMTTYATQRLLPEQSKFLKAFGQPGRESPCACERSSEPTLEQALQLLNGPAVLGWVANSYKAYDKLPDEKVVQSIYLKALSRYPTEQQLAIGKRHIQETRDRNAAITDLVWAIINSQEFLFQH